MRRTGSCARPYNALVPAPHHAVDHYENFPVASWLMPARLRPAVISIYRFARHADDLADEGQVCAHARHAALADLRAQLARAQADRPVEEPLIQALLEPMRAHALPWSCLDDLLSAFTQDIDVHRYDTHEAVMDYCRRSANPIGRLVLALACVNDAKAINESDAICSALQRINFLQDLGIDWSRGRLYLPRSLLEDHQIEESAIALACAQGYCDERLRACIATEALACRGLLFEGRALPRRVGGRMGLELRAILAGGELILDRLAQQGHDPIRQRPQLRRSDAIPLAWALCRGVRAPAPSHPTDELRALG
jgi:squalene synthase HpnC